MRESAAGEDGVTINMLRLSSPEFQQALFALVRRAWRQPEAWEPEAHRAIVLALFEKGDRARLDNYRGICLLSIISRVVARTISIRLMTHAERHGVFRADQWGFRPWRSTRDAILLARLLVEGATKAKTPEDMEHLVFSLLDIRKACPSVPRNAAWQVLRHRGVPEHVVTLLTHVRSDTEYRCRNQQGLSEPYHLYKGLREGCPSSCVVYLYFHDVVLRDAVQQLTAAGHTGVTVRSPPAPPAALKPMPREAHTRLRDSWDEVLVDLVCFADDTALCGREGSVRERCQATAKVLADWREYVHPDKWHHLRLRHRLDSPVQEAPWPRRRHTQKRQTPFRAPYDEHVELLGAWLSADGSGSYDLGRRLKAARKLRYQVYRRLPRLGLTQRDKGRVFCTTVVASLLYASETRCVRGLTLSEHFRIRDMKGRFTMADLRKRAGVPSIPRLLGKRKLGYLGHLARYPASRIEQRVAFGVLEPEERAEGWLAVAQRRDRWRELVSKWEEQAVVKEESDCHAVRHAARDAQAAADIPAPLLPPAAPVRRRLRGKQSPAAALAARPPSSR
ncbi:unnamed protein product, partial [Prorocentrum cordatum]